MCIATCLRSARGFAPVSALLSLVLLGAPLGTRSARAQAVIHTLSSPNETAFGNFGNAVAGAGDVDGDGVPDVVVGAPRELAGPISAGRAYVFSGATGAALDTLDSNTPAAGGFFGFAVAGLGDVDDDGRPDAAVGAQWEQFGGGRVHVFSGATGAPLFTLTSPNEQAFGIFGYAVAGVRDTDGDGRGDVLVGAPGEDPDPSPSSAGRAYVFSGTTGDTLYTLRSPAEVAGGEFGIAVAGLGDLDGDGRGDIAVGAPDEPEAALEAGGHVHVFSGATGALLRTLASPNAQAQGRFGYRLAALGDADGDGRGDLVVGAYQESSGGRAYVFNAATGALLHTLAHPTGSSQAAFGFAIGGAGDVDGDGRGDVLVGVEADGPPNAPSDLSGRAYVFSGADGALLATLTSPGSEPVGHFGNAVAGAGDIDGDGRAEVVVGAYLEDPGASPDDAGRAYLLDVSAVVGTEPRPDAAGLSLALAPNPTAGGVTFYYGLAEAGPVRLTVYDALGREVAVVVDGERGAGPHTAVFDGSALASGVYVARLVAGGAAQAHRLMLLR